MGNPEEPNASAQARLSTGVRLVYPSGDISLAYTTPLAYSHPMLLIETPIFTQRMQRFLSDERYRLLQQQLVAKPDTGRVIPGSGGLRNMRWSVSGRGTRGGIRSIYH